MIILWTLFSAVLASGSTAMHCDRAIASLTDSGRYEFSLDVLEQNTDVCTARMVSALQSRELSVHQTGSIYGVLCRMESKPEKLGSIVLEMASPEEENLTVRRMATSVLTCFLPFAETVKHLREALDDPSVEIRQSAIRSIGETQDLVESLLPAILHRMDVDPNPEMRCWSIERLEALSPVPEQAIVSLCEKRRDPVDYVRNCALETIEILEISCEAHN